MTATQVIPFARPWITEEDRQAVLEVLRSDVLTHGPQGHHFEEEFARLLGGEAYCVSVSSGMAALHLAYFDMGIGPGDEVIVPAQTHIATAHAVEIMGARPVFIDCDPATGNLDPRLLESLVTPQTKAIGLVHFLGMPCSMDAIMEIAQRHHLKVVEDCALALGARYRGRHVGLIGDAGCFSFYPVKHITTGDGGMFVTRHKEVAERVAKARAFGVNRAFSERSLPGLYDVPTLGLNYRMSDINAALGRRQLTRIEEILRRRRRNFLELKSRIQDLPGVTVLDAEEIHGTNSHYCLSAVLEGPLKNKRDTMARKLKEAGIGTSVYYPQPVPRMTYYKNKYACPDRTYLNATVISDHSIALPVGPHLSEEDLDLIAATFCRLVKESAHDH